jgi:hypothetical protein
MLEEQGHHPSDLHKAIDRGYQWATRFRSASSGVAPTCRHWETWSPSGEGLLGYRNLGIPANQADSKVMRLV